MSNFNKHIHLFYLFKPVFLHVLIQGLSMFLFLLTNDSARLKTRLLGTDYAGIVRYFLATLAMYG